MRRVWGAVLVAGVVLTSATAKAQGDPYARVSFSTTQVYEDNLFAGAASPDRQSDLIFRFGPAFEAGYVSVPLKLIARYAFEGERYLDHVTLNRNFARQDASLELHPVNTRRLALAARASYVETHTPHELNLETGLTAGRARAQRLAAGTAATYEWDPVTKLSLGYGFGRDALAGAVSTEIHDARIGVARQTRRSQHRVDYGFRYFGFGDGAAVASHVVVIGWSHDITRLTAIDVALGPRISQGSVRPELAASLRRQLQKWAFSTGYSRTQATAIGERGAIDVQRVGVVVSSQAGRRLALTAAPAFISINAPGDRTRVSVYALDMEAVARGKRGFSVVAAGRIGLQQGTLAGRREQIPYRSLSLRLVATLPRTSRIDQPRS